MTMYNRRKEKLINELKDKEYREAFVSAHIDTGIPFQIRALRKQREWKQGQLADRAGKKQETISRLENPNYASLSLTTLKELASAFDVGLMVRFVPISDLVEWELGLTSESLNAISFDEDIYFKDKLDDISATKSDAIETSTEDLSRTAASTNIVVLFNRPVAEKQTLNTSRLNQCSA